MTRRFLLFKWQAYEARGGWRDFHSAFENLEEARQEGLKDSDSNIFHVVDTTTWEIVAEDED